MTESAGIIGGQILNREALQLVASVHCAGIHMLCIRFGIAPVKSAFADGEPFLTASFLSGGFARKFTVAQHLCA